MHRLLPFHRFRWYARLPLKWLVFGLTCLFATFPYPVRFVEHLSRWRNPNALIAPDSPALEPLAKELESRVTQDMSGKQAMNVVERLVYERIPYDWDWNVWGNADHLPTVEEALEKGREDCDGRAVVAASLLARLGYRAELVSDFTHVWVKTDQGETLGPGKTKALIVKDGRVSIQPGAVGQAVRALGYGVAVFPAHRMFSILLVLWYLLLRPGTGTGFALASLALFFSGLVMLGMGGADHVQPDVRLQLFGLGDMLLAVCLLIFWGSWNAHRKARLQEMQTATQAKASPPDPLRFSEGQSLNSQQA